MRVLTFLLLLFLLNPCLSEVSHPMDSIKFRARESYETLKFEYDGQTQTYRGFTNTINLFYEKPLQYSFGFAFGSIFSGLKAKDNQSLTNLGNEVEFLFAGLESKLFFLNTENRGFFFRPGFYLQSLKSRGPSGDIKSSALLGGLGYEFLVYENISLAPEFAYKSGSAGDFNFSGYTLSLGVHFYSF